MVPEHFDALGELVANAMRSMETQTLLARMVEEEVPVGPVLDFDEIPADPQIAHNGSILEFEHPTAGRFRQAGPAARFEKTPQDPRRHLPPLYGEHTDEVLRELGYEDADLARLREAATIA